MIIVVVIVLKPLLEVIPQKDAAPQSGEAVSLLTEGGAMQSIA